MRKFIFLILLCIPLLGLGTIARRGGNSGTTSTTSAASTSSTTTTAACSDTIIQTAHPEGSVTIIKMANATTYHVGNKFTANATYNATKVDVNMKRVGCAGDCGNFTLLLCDDDSGSPATTASGNCAASSAIAINTLSTSAITQTFVIAKSLNSGSSYWIKGTASQLNDASNYAALVDWTAGGLYIKAHGAADESGAWTSVKAGGEFSYSIYDCE